MASSISWLDFDSTARDQSQQLLALFNEPDTRDELGLGNIRDALADLMFPGTSTIQTRLKYMLLVPWVYARLEAERVPGREFAQRARDMEVALIRVLARPGETGIIGAMAGGGLQRLPSSIYWAGLDTWGIRLWSGSQSRYHQSIDLIHARRKAQERHRKRREPDPVAWGANTWHSFVYDQQRLTVPLREQVIELTLDEAEFLRDRMLASQPGTYLAWLAQLNEPDGSEFPWMHSCAAALPADIANLVHHARLFSHLMHGASLLYNFLLARCREKSDWADKYAEQLDEWRERTPWGELAQWPLDTFFDLAGSTSHRIRPSAETFVRNWHELACQTAAKVVDNQQADWLIRKRERTLKRSRSRFDNASARARWRGDSGTAQFSYRWRNVQWFMQDLQTGLER